MSDYEAYTFLQAVSKVFPMQAVEKLKDAIVEEACSINRIAGGPALTVRVEFQLTSRKLGKSERSDIATKLGRSGSRNRC